MGESIVLKWMAMKRIRPAIWVPLILVLIIVKKVRFCESRDDTTSLYNYIRSTSYLSSVMPSCENGKRLVVNIEIALRDIVELVEKQQLIRLKIWVRLNWNDRRLRWNPADFNGLNEIVLPFDEIWTPDITLFEGVNDEDNLPGMENYRALVNHQGEVIYNFPSIVTAVCKMDVSYFPLDHQVCSLKFGSWIYSGKYIDMRSKKHTVDISSFLAHSEWDVVDTMAKRHELFYGCCNESYVDMTFYLHLKRKPIFYIITIIFPSFIVTALTILGFILPVESGEKIGLQITVLLSLTVFLLLVQDMLPSSAETAPYLAVYFSVSMLLVCVSCIFSTVVLCAYFKLPAGPNHHGNFQNQEFDVSSDVPRFVGRSAHARGKLRHRLSEFLIPPTLRWNLMAEKLDRGFMWIYLFMTGLTNFVFVVLMLNYDGPSQHLELVARQ